MFQSFEATTRPDDAPPRIAALREAMAKAGVDAVLVPRADAHQGEYVAPSDERLAWLTGFTGSAGFAAVTADRAALFVDGRYTVQAPDQVPTDLIEVLQIPDAKLSRWLSEALPEGATVAYDPWLHTVDEVRRLEKALAPKIALAPRGNLVDAVWSDRPPRPAAPVTVYPDALAGEGHAEKRARLAKDLRQAGDHHAVLSLPDSICWLLNIRGGDIARIPVVHAFAVLGPDARVDLFTDAPMDDAVHAHLGEDVRRHPYGAVADHLAGMKGRTLRLDPSSAPEALARAAGDAAVDGDDPCVLPKARKSAAELAATRDAHRRDAVAMVEFLAWLDATAQDMAPGALTEIDVVRALEGFRRQSNALRDISFDTIAGSGPHGAVVHYRVTEGTNRALAPGELLLVDSGGQYLDGTTDITRTVAIGDPTDEQRAAFTRVLRGMIEVSRARWPKGLTGRDLDPLARIHLWRSGQDYDHGTGHGVGVYLSVHEGPARISRRTDVALEPGMILSNEPGYYRAGAFGIRIENLVVVTPAPDLPGADAREMLAFETLTWVPIDIRLIDGTLPPEDRAWLNAYHATVRDTVAPHVGDATRTWLDRATAPI